MLRDVQMVSSPGAFFAHTASQANWGPAKYVGKHDKVGLEPLSGPHWFTVACKFLAQPLQYSITNSLSMAASSSDWCMVNLCSIHKNGHPEGVSSNQRVRLAYMICKAFVWHLNKAFLLFFIDSSAISCYRHGFLPRWYYVPNMWWHDVGRKPAPISLKP